MKKMMMIVAMMVATLSANAQNEVGQFSIQPKAGINISKITGSGMTSSTTVHENLLTFWQTSIFSRV